jgi:hypothetical protein
MSRLTLGKGEAGRDACMPVKWGEGLAGSVAEEGHHIIVQVDWRCWRMWGMLACFCSVPYK